MFEPVISLQTECKDTHFLPFIINFDPKTESDSATVAGGVSVSAYCVFVNPGYRCVVGEMFFQIISKGVGEKWVRASAMALSMVSRGVMQ